MPVLGYWKMRGIAQPIRHLLAYTFTKFEDKHYQLTESLMKDNWYKEKNTLGLELPNLPYYIDGDLKLSQSRVILRTIAEEKAPVLLGKTKKEKQRGEMMEGHLWDIWTSLLVLCYHAYSEEARMGYLTYVLPAHLESLVAFKAKNKWMMGNALSYIDFLAYEVLYQHQVFSSNCLDEFPALKELMRNFENIPQIEEYMKSPNYIKAPLYHKQFKHYI